MGWVQPVVGKVRFHRLHSMANKQTDKYNYKTNKKERKKLGELVADTASMERRISLRALSSPVLLFSS